VATKRGRKGTSKAKPKRAARKPIAKERSGSPARPAPSREPKPAERQPSARAAEPRPATTPAPAQRGGAVSAALLAQARALRDAIEQSKLTASDPWGYTTKARAWSRRAQALMDEAARGGDGGVVGRQLETLKSEVERDSDFQEARRRA
jgi:hypothetical protein